MNALTNGQACAHTASGVTMRIGTLWIAVVMTLAMACAPCFAWLYNTGSVGRTSLGVSDTSSTNWAAQPFAVASDAYVTGVGAAVGRGAGTASMGYNVYLTTTLSDIVANALGTWTISPVGPIPAYHDVQTDAPIKLNAGATYYLAFIPNSNNFVGSIALASPAGWHGLGTSNYGQTWGWLDLPFCVRVDGYAAPEPASLAGLAVGLLGVGIRPLLRRRCGSRRAADRA